MTWLWLAAWGVFDGAATGVALARDQLALPLGAHALVVFAVGLGLRCSASQRWLVGAAVLAIPGAGIMIAASVALLRGRGRFVRSATPRQAWRLSAASARQLASRLSPCEALSTGDSDERRQALSALACRNDHETRALLRWAAAHRDSELALYAALVLDELDARDARRRRASAHVARTGRCAHGAA